jgi:Domain of unknown function (DUF6985)
MNIPQLGPLHPDSRIPEWLVSEPVSVPYFDGRQLTFTLDGLAEADEQDVQSAVSAFLALDSAARLEASPYVFRNYQRMVDAVGEDQVECRVASPEAIWAHVHPSEIFVSRRPRRDQLIYIQITAECDWEHEHGLQIVYRRGCELSRVSDQDGHLTHTDAYDMPEDQDKIA